MENRQTGAEPRLSHAEPVLPVSDVEETIRYWQDVLGFPGHWVWGDPPANGAVSWHGAFIQFYRASEQAVRTAGTAVWIRLQNVETLYRFHRGKDAEIVAPLENQPWGMAQYSLREINGHYVHFAGAPLSETGKSEAALPPEVRIVARMPSGKEIWELVRSVGWSSSPYVERNEVPLPLIEFAVVAENASGGEVIGCAFILGDQDEFHYVRNVIVHPAWQRKRVGSALMLALTHWLDTHAAPGSTAWLHTTDNLAPFYQQFDFFPAFGMVRKNRRT